MFIGVSHAGISTQRVAMRVAQGGHDVPPDKLAKRFPRTMRNLERAIERLPHVLVFDNSDLANPFRKVAEFVNAKVVMLHEQIPAWLPIKKKRRRKRKS